MSFGRIAAIALLGWVTIMVVGSRGTAPAALVAIPASEREPASFSAFPLLDGGRWSLESAKGKVVLVNLWATWCPPCIAETPNLVEIAKDFKAQGLEVVGVSMDSGDDRAIRRFVQKYGISYPIARGREERTFSLGVPLPTTMVFDRSGRLALRTTGVINDRSLRQALTRLLREGS